MNKMYTLSPNEMKEYTRIYIEESPEKATKYLNEIKEEHNLDDDVVIRTNPCVMCHNQSCNEKEAH